MTDLDHVYDAKIELYLGKDFWLGMLLCCIYGTVLLSKQKFSCETILSFHFFFTENMLF